MDFVKTEGGIFVPVPSAGPPVGAASPDQKDEGWRRKSRRLLRSCRDPFILAIQLVTAFILYLNYTHTVVPTEQKDRLAEQVATLEKDAEKVTADVKEKLSTLRSLQGEVAQSNAQLSRLRSDRDVLLHQIDASQLLSKRANEEAASANGRLKKAAQNLELAQWSIFHQRVSLETIRPHIEFMSANINYPQDTAAMATTDPVGTIVQKYKTAWPDIPALSARVASSIRNLHSDLYPAWMSKQFADVYESEARFVHCDRPDFDAIQADYEKQYASASVAAAAQVQAIEARSITEQQRADGQVKARRVRYVIDAAEHKAILSRALVDKQVDVISDVRAKLYPQAEKCVAELSKVGDDFLNKKDKSPQTIPTDLLN